MFGVTLIDKKIQLFVTDAEDLAAKETLSKYANPIIVQITSRTTENQMWPIENWNELVLVMKEFTFIQLGTEKEVRIEGAIDMRGKTTTREAIALVKHALSFVGIVSFLSHVTNAFDKPGVILFGGVSAVSVWGHENNINILKTPPCSPCVDVLLGQACPYDKPCMREITVAEVRESIYKQVPGAIRQMQPLSS
jgi:ADP-heptose:LPS heptosyltransferase